MQIKRNRHPLKSAPAFWLSGRGRPMLPESFTLDNGLTVIVENIPYRNSATAGLWIPMGSRFERKNEAGYSHFVEHMLFKGTQKRDYTEISRAIDRLGGHLNASTSKEITDIYVSLSGRHLAIALDVLADMFYNSHFNPAEFASEKKVILEEIKMAEDQPDEYLFDLFYEHAYGDNSLGRSVGGYVATIRRARRDDLYDYYCSHYGPRGTVLSLAGSLWKSGAEKKRLLATISRLFDRNDHPLRGEPGFRSAQFNDPEFQTPRTLHTGYFAHKTKNLEQVNFVLALPGLKYAPRQPADLGVLTHYLGGTMSSRLFIELREKRGLCYTVSTMNSQFLHEGVWGIYCGTSPEKYAQAIQTALGELQNLASGIPEKDLEESKSGLKGAIELGMENSYRRANYNAQCWLYHGELFDWRDYLVRIDQVNEESLLATCRRLWQDVCPTLVGLGPRLKRATRQRLERLISQPVFS